jgi:hypothetical protein
MVLILWLLGGYWQFLGLETCCCYYYCYYCCFCFVLKSLTLPILPLPPSNRYHSNRTDLLCPMVPLPPRHCHSPRHYHPCNHPYHCHTTAIFLSFFIQITATLPILPLPPSNRYHSNRTDLTNRLVPLPPCHCHPLGRHLGVWDGRRGNGHVRVPVPGPWLFFFFFFHLYDFYMAFDFN